MKKVLLPIIILLILNLTACGQEPLKFRNLNEADQYIRNNIKDIEWKQFKRLSFKDNNVSEEDFSYLKSILTKQYSSSSIIVNDKLYRFQKDQTLMYMTSWKEKDGSYYLIDISYIH